MAAKPGPLLLMAGAAALLLAKKTKAKSTDEKPDYGNLPPPPGPIPEPGPVDIVPAGTYLDPGFHTVGVGSEYLFPYPKGDAEDLTVFKSGGMEGKDGEEGAWSDVATYGPNEDYVWEKWSENDYMVIQFQRAGNYSFSTPIGNYELKAI